MSLHTLAGVALGAAALRVAFLVLHLGDPRRLWDDYERRGARFFFARGLDLLTLVAVFAAAVWALWGLNGATPQRYGTVFVAWLAVSLLRRLPVHRFPRTNVAGAWAEAKVDLIVQTSLAVLEALAATALAAAYFWWHG